MSGSLALEPPPVSGERTTTQATPIKFGALFKAAMESLVRAQRGRYEASEPLLYRFPPL